MTLINTRLKENEMFSQSFVDQIKNLEKDEQITVTIIKRKQKDHLGFDIEFCEVKEEVKENKRSFNSTGPTTPRPACQPPQNTKIKVEPESTLDRLKVLEDRVLLLEKLIDKRLGPIPLTPEEKTNNEKTIAFVNKKINEMRDKSYNLENPNITHWLE